MGAEGGGGFGYLRVLPDAQKFVPPHGHVRSQLFHLVRFLRGVPPFAFHGRRNERPLSSLLQLVAVLVEVMVHLTLSSESSKAHEEVTLKCTRCYND